MMLNKDKLEMIRQRYTLGSTIELIYMDDEYAPKPGTRGKVMFIDDAGTIHVEWENGSSLGVIYGVDEIKLVKEK